MTRGLKPSNSGCGAAFAGPPVAHRTRALRVDYLALPLTLPRLLGLSATSHGGFTRCWPCRHGRHVRFRADERHREVIMRPAPTSASRRSFLATSAAAGAVGMLHGNSAAARDALAGPTSER